MLAMSVMIAMRLLTKNPMHLSTSAEYKEIQAGDSVTLQGSRGSIPRRFPRASAAKVGIEACRTPDAVSPPPPPECSPTLPSRHQTAKLKSRKGTHWPGLLHSADLFSARG